MPNAKAVEGLDAGLFEAFPDLAMKPADLLALEASVVDISYSGQHLSIRLRVADADALILAKVDTGDPDVAGIERGQTLWCCWPQSASRILPRESQSEV